MERTEKGLDIIKSLRGSTSGYAVPTFAVDIPCGGGKVAFTPNQVVGRDGDFILLNNFEDRKVGFQVLGMELAYL